MKLKISEMKDLKINRIVRLSIIGMMIPLIFSCSKPLTREEAAKQIEAKFRFPQNELRDIELRVYAGEYNYYENIQTGERKINALDGGDQRRAENSYFTQLKNQGLINVTRTEAISNQYGNPFNKSTLNTQTKSYDIATFTDKGMQYVIDNKIKVATIRFVEITGMVESKESNTTLVNYTTKRIDITPFGLIGLHLTEETFIKNISFIKYDDGWRIE